MMEEMVQDTSVCPLTLSAQEVADAFVKQYYHILHTSPEDVHKFYKDDSILGRPGSEGRMLSVTTMKGINDAIISSNIKSWEPNLEAVYAQESIMGSVIVGVTGSLTEKDNVARSFMQAFFLAPQEPGGFYVHNDFLQLVEKNKPLTTASVVEVVVNSPTVPVPQDPEAAVVSDKEQTRISDPTPKEASEIVKKVDSQTIQNKKSVVPVIKPVLNAQEDTKNSMAPVTKPVLNAQEETQKISYASIVAKEGPLASPQVTSLPAAKILAKADPQAPHKSPTLPTKAPAPPSNGAPSNGAPSNGGLEYNNVNGEAPKAIHIRDLPSNITHEALLQEIKKFGAVKPRSIQIREYPEDGYRYAFVEFESSKSAHSAVEAGEISIGDKTLGIQYKKSSSQGGNNQSRSTSGRGGAHNDSVRGRDEGRGNRYDEHELRGQARGSALRNQGQARGGSRRNGETFSKGSTILVE